jgi:hypothetical protein
VDTATDRANCGGCAKPCATGSTCQASACVMQAACPAPPGASVQAVAALTRQNTNRAGMGLACANMIPTINTSAQKHCDYYVADKGVTMCVANPHVEVSGCSLFVAANFDARMRAAGYTGSQRSEVMAFFGDGARAMQIWIDSVYHRTPVLDPWLRDMGYGGGTGCDTVDLGVGTGLPPSSTIAVFPFANQTGVPTSFDGRQEGPMPPTPSSGWPSGYPIHIYVRQATITSHTLTKDSDTVAIPHVWITSADPLLLGDAYVMYANTPLAAATKYRVQVAGSNGAAFNLNWTFTTR